MPVGSTGTSMASMQAPGAGSAYGGASQGVVAATPVAPVQTTATAQNTAPARAQGGVIAPAATVVKTAQHVQRPVAIGAAAGASTKRPAKKRKAAAEVPEQAVQVCANTPLLNTLVRLEARVDAACRAREAEVTANLVDGHPPHAKHKLRLYIFHEHHNQRGACQEPPSWSLCIHGRLLPHDPDSEAGAAAPPVPEPAKGPNGATSGSGPAAEPMTSFVESLNVRLTDPARQYEGTDAGEVRWEAAEHDGPHMDRVELHRLGKLPVTATITLGMRSQPAMWLVAEPLSSLLGVRLDSRVRILDMLQDYIERHNLKDPSNLDQIICDINLRHVFGVHTMAISSLPQRLSSLLSRPPPVRIVHELSAGGSSPSEPDCIDVDVIAPTASAASLPPTAGFLERGAAAQADEAAASATLSAALSRAAEAARRRDLLLGFANEPSTFVRRMVERSAPAVRQVRGGAAADVMAMSETDFFREKWVEEAAVRYLQRQPPRP